MGVARIISEGGGGGGGGGSHYVNTGYLTWSTAVRKWSLCNLALEKIYGICRGAGGGGGGSSQDPLIPCTSLIHCITPNPVEKDI